MTMFDTSGEDASASAYARALLLEHARARTYRRELPDATAVHEEENLLCGDSVKIFVRVADGGMVITDMAYTGTGCIISQAAASLVCEHAVGKTCPEVTRMGRADIEALLGSTLTPSRVKCATLPLVALQRLLECHNGEKPLSASDDH